MKQTYDVVIAGGGLAGTATALSLLHAGVKSVLVVERGSYQQIKVGESLSPDAGVQLSRLGIDSDFLNKRYLSSPGHRSYWGSNSPGTTDFATHPFGEGWHIDRRDLEQHLAYQASRKGADIATAATLKNCTTTSDLHTVFIQTNEGEKKVSCRFVTDASGYRGSVAGTLGGKTTQLDKQLFICGFFELPANSPIDHQTMIEAVEHGWWYRARLPDNKLVMSFATCPEIYKSKRLYHWQKWLNELADSSIVSQSLEDARFSPSSMQQLSGATYLRSAPDITNKKKQSQNTAWTCVGDASMGIDPIFGRGMVNALESGADAGVAIAHWLRGDCAPLQHLEANTRKKFDGYQKQRATIYQWEQRWPDSPFWSSIKP